MLLEAFKNLFDNKQTSELSVDDHSVVMAAGALMLEIARSDHDISEDEKDLIFRSVKGLLGEAETQIAEIFDRISEEVEESVSLYDFTSIINENFLKFIIVSFFVFSDYFTRIRLSEYWN